QGLVRGRHEGATPARLGASVLEPRGARPDVRLVPRQPRAHRRRRHASRAVEPAGTRPAEEAVLMLFLSQAEVRDLLDLDALVDAGVQARTHARPIPRVRPIDEIRVAGRDRAKAEALANEIGGVAVESYEDAIRGADDVAATTHAVEPVVRREWLEPGTHINSV